MKTWSGKLGSNERPLDYRSSAQTHAEPCYSRAFPDYRFGASPPVLAALVILEPKAELFHLSYSGLERVRRIELRRSDWRSDAQPIGHTRGNFGADGDNRNLFSGLEAQGTPIYHARSLSHFRDAYSIVKYLL